MFYLNSTLNFGIPPVLVFQLEVYYKVDRLLTGLTAQPKGTTARWYSNKTSLCMCKKIKIQNVSALFIQTGILKTKCHFLRTAKTYNTSICAFNLQAYN